MITEKQKRQLDNLVEKALTRETNRPEQALVSAAFDSYMRTHHLARKQEADLALYEEIYNVRPDRESQYLKIRFWRTGRHFPSNRKECLAFAKALGMNPEDTKRLLTEWWEHSDFVWDAEPSESERIYWERRKQIQELTEEFFLMTDPFRRPICGKGEKKNLRHLYCMEAAGYISTMDPQYEGKMCMGNSVSAYYNSEFLRLIRLSGEIPRRSMLRFLFVILGPFVSAERMSAYLTQLGYCGLGAKHTDVLGTVTK